MNNLFKSVTNDEKFSEALFACLAAKGLNFIGDAYDSSAIIAPDHFNYFMITDNGGEINVDKINVDHIGAAPIRRSAATFTTPYDVSCWIAALVKGGWSAFSEESFISILTEGDEDMIARVNAIHPFAAQNIPSRW